MRPDTLRTASSLVVLALCLFAAALQLAAQQAFPPARTAPDDQQLCTVAGMVTSAATGEPLKKAQVILAVQEQQPPHQQIAITDAAGHFEIHNLTPGHYSLIVIRTSYIPQTYGQDQPDKPGAVLTLAAGQKLSDLIFRLQRMAVITGRVVDEDGEPIPNANVEVLSRSRDRKGAPAQQESQTSTNDLGEYRLFDLTPGHYYVRVSDPRQNMVTDDSLSGDSAQAAVGTYAPSFYPGTADLARASIIDVKAGDEIPRIDFVLVPSRDVHTYKIKGRLTNSIIGRIDSRVFVLARPRGEQEFDFATSPSARPDSDTGNFELKGIAPGAYTVFAILADGGKMRSARQDVDVNASDVTGVSLVLTNGTDISGRVTLEGGAAKSANHLSVSLGPKDDQTMFGGWQEASVQRDGTFVLSGVGEGSYAINVTSNCEQCYLKAAASNSVDLLEKGVEVASGAAPTEIDLVYSSNTGAASGMVTTPDGLPATGAFVVLMADKPPAPNLLRNRRAAGSGQTDQYGNFEIRGIPPGKYTAFAWDRVVEPDTYSDPDFLKSFEGMGQPVDISANDRRTIQLKLIDVPSADSQN